jgi:tetratricopeptide (TPR) repeat protein
VNAAEAFGWASRSMEFRAVAIAQLAEVSLIEKDYTRAVAYARQALDYDAYSVNAIETLAIALRLAGEKDRAAAALSRLTDVDHLSHFVDFERFLSGGSGSLSAAFEDAIRAEFRDQTYVELALSYYNRGQVDEADRIFRMGNENGGNEIARIWVAYLSGEVLSSADVAARPYRPETARALEWLVAQDGAWQWKYLLALNYWALDRVEEASDLMTALVDAPDEPSVYIARAALLQTANGLDQGSDLRRALSVDDSQRVTWLHLQRYYEDAGAWEDALELSQDMFSRFPSDFVVRLARARALLRNEQPLEAIAVLQDTQVLPAEGAGDGRTLYSQANTLAGIRAVDAGDCFGARSFLLEALEWPEHLGQGRPYEPDERLPRFLLLYCQSLGTTDATVLDDYEAHRRYYEEALSGGAESIDGFEMTLVQKALNATHE